MTVHRASVLITATFVSLAVGVARAAPVDMTGTWLVTIFGGQAPMDFVQSGSTLTSGTYSGTIDGVGNFDISQPPNACLITDPAYIRSTLR